MKFRSFLLFLLLFLIGSTVKGAVEDSAAMTRPLLTVSRYVHSKAFLENSKSWKTLDTSLTNVSEVNPAFRLDYNFLGNLGSASKARMFSVESDILPKASIRAYDIYLWTADSIRYYRTNKRYTRLDYHSATFKEQEIRFLHSQNILKTWSAGIDFHRLGVKDFTRNSDTYHNQISLFSWYQSPNSKYNLFAGVIWNAVKNQLNGGMQSDSLFDTGTVENIGLKGLNINLADAKHQVRNQIFSVTNSYNLLPTPDSTGASPRIFGTFILRQSTTYERGSYAYSDAVADSAYYQDFFSETVTYDSMHYDDLKNSFGFLLPASDSSTSFLLKNFSTTVDLEYQWFRYTQRDNFDWNNIILKASLFTPEKKSNFGISVSTEYVIEGENEGMYKFTGRINSPTYKIGGLYASLSAVRRKADLIYQNYYSNHFIWNNQLDAIQTQSLSAGFVNVKYAFKVEAAIHTIQNFVTAGEDARPIQDAGNFEVSQIKVLKNFKFRKLHFDNSVYFQQSENEKLLPLSQLSGTHALYIESFYFKKALLAQYGFKLRYNSEYYSENFMPATGLFYVQAEKKTGGHPMLDLFINVKIKTASLFFKIENLADGLVKTHYYLTPGYPQPGRTFQFGLSWRFHDM